MDAEANFSQVAPLVFYGETYELWAVRMESYLEALDLWKAVEEDYDVPPLPTNPTMAQIKNHKEKKTKKAKAKTCLFAGVSKTIFTRIMTLKTAKAIWNYLKEEYAGDQRIRSMQVIILRREFELQKMKESETIKEYSDKLHHIANKVRLLGAEFPDSRIVEKILVTLPESYKASIATLEHTKDLCKITLAEVLYALKAQEQRRLMMQEGSMEGAFQVKLQINNNGKSHSNKPEGPAKSRNNNQSINTQLMEKGHKVLFEDKNCMIKDSEGREVYKVQMKGKSFVLDFMNKEQAAMHKEVSSTMLWHKRLGHYHHAALLFMKKNNLVKDLPKLEVMPPECAACQYRKQTRLPFQQNKAWRATQKLQLAHTDVGGPMKTP